MNQSDNQNKKNRAVDRLKSSTGRQSKRNRKLERLLALLGAGLAIAALVLIINYQKQANALRREQEALRLEYQQALEQDQASPETGNSPAPSEDRERMGSPQDAALTAGTSAQDNPPSPDLQNTPLPQQPGMAERFLPLMRRNRDVVGWLNYPGIAEMDFAIVQRDNEYYLDRDFSQGKNLAGTVFLDASNQIWPKDQNLVLHGHNMQNGTMFGKLKRLMEPAYFKANPLVQFDTLYEDRQYVPYAVSLFSANPDNPRYFNIIQPQFQTPEQMGEYVNWLRARSALAFPTPVSADDSLLTLVTCHGLDPDERLAVALRALRPGENMSLIKEAFAEGLKKP